MNANPFAQLRANALAVLRIAAGWSVNAGRGGGGVRRGRYAVEGLEPRRLLAAVNWVGAASGDWDTAANWSSGVVPTTTDDVTINTAPGIVVTHSGNTDAVNSLTSNNPIVLSGGTLFAATFLQLTNSFTIAGGTLSGGTVSGTANALVTSAGGGTLDGVTLSSDISIPDGANLVVTDGLTLNGANINLSADGVGATLTFNNVSSQSISGTGGIVFAGSTPALNTVFIDNSANNLTISPGVSISGPGGTITSIGSGGNVSAQGTISANAVGPGIIISGQNWQNTGTLSASNGGTLAINADVGDGGSITENNATLFLGGLVPDLTNLTRTGGTINLTGSIQADGAVVTFNAVTGSINLDGGAVAGCEIAFNAGNSLVPTATGGTFDNVTLDNNFDLLSNTTLTVTDGLVLNNAAITIEPGAQLNFDNSSPQVIDGNGQFILNGGSTASDDEGEAGFTLNAGVSVFGVGAFAVGPSDLIFGTITANIPSQVLEIAGTSASDMGNVQAVNGGILNVDPDLGPMAMFSETNSTLNFTGALTALPNVVHNGGNVNIAGELILGGANQTFDDTTGVWQLSGQVINGSLTFAGGGELMPVGLSPMLVSVTLNSTMTISDEVTLGIMNGLTLNNANVVIASNTGMPATLAMENSDSQSILGNGQIIFSGQYPTQDSVSIDNTFGDATIGAGITIDGRGGNFKTFGAGGVCMLQGTVSSDTTGDTLTIAGTSIVYQGTLSADGGSISILGDYNGNAVSAVDVVINSATPGQVNITGNAALGGSLNVLLAANYIPPTGSTYNVITYSASTGAFASVNGLASANGTFTSSPTPTAFELTTTVGGPPTATVDLSIVSLSSSGGTYLPGDAFTGGGQYFLSGTASGPIQFDIEIVLSTDSVFGNADDVVLEVIPLTASPTATPRDFEISAPMPAVALPGTYQLAAYIDNTGIVSETNETNNSFVSALNNIVVNAAPPATSQTIYLTLSNVLYTGGNYAPGDTFNATGTAQNFGPGDTGTLNVQFDLSQDAVFGNRDDVLLQTVQIDGFDGPGSGTGSVQGIIPANTPAGAYHVVAEIYSNTPALETQGSANIYVSPAADIVLPAAVVAVPAPLPVKIGSPDPNFGVNGLAAHDVGITTTADVAVQSDGKSVIAGTSGVAGSRDFALTRYTAAGGIDASFGNGGTVTTDFGGDDQAAAIDILADGKILVVGTSIRMVDGLAAGSEFAIARYNADGSLDTSFGGGTGMVLTSFAASGAGLSNDVAHAVTVRADGTIFVAGTSNAGATENDFAVAAYSPNGNLLSGFGQGGKVLLDFDGGNDAGMSIALQKNGSIVLAGSTEGPATGITSMGVARLKATGAVDKTFGDNGRVTKSIRGIDDEAASVAIEKNGQIIVGGFSATGSLDDGSFSTDFALAAFTAGGKVNAGFGHGAVVTPFGQPSAITRVIIQSNGEIDASGKTTGSLASLMPNQLEIALARYTPSGALDKTFSATGTAIINPGGGTVSSPRTVHRAESTAELMDDFNALKQSTQGVMAVTQGGELLALAESGTDTVEAQVIANGVDLVAHLVGATPHSVIGGAKGSINVVVNNAGPDAASGAVTVSLYTSANNAVESDSTLLHASPGKVHLKVGGSQTFKFKYTFPTTLTDGSYFLVANVNGGSLSETDVANNTAASSSVTIDKPAVDLTGSKLQVPTALTPGKPAAVSFTIMNAGNITAAGAISIAFYASADGTIASGQLLTTVNNVKLGLKAGAAKPFKETFPLPANLPAGTYALLALLDPGNTLNESDATNNTIVSGGMFTV